MPQCGYPGIGTRFWHVSMLPAGVLVSEQQALFCAATGAIRGSAGQAAFARRSNVPIASAPRVEAQAWWGRSWRGGGGSSPKPGSRAWREGGFRKDVDSGLNRTIL